MENQTRYEPLVPRPTTLQKVALLVLVGCVSACNNADFGSEANKTEDIESATTKCDAERHYVEEDLAVKIKNDKSAKMVLTGEFCPQAPAQLDIVFLIDFSLSMYNKDVEPKRGNDQVVNGSCARLDAAKAIMERHKRNVADQNAAIRVGVIQFASDLVGDLPLTDLDETSDELTVENFCRGLSGTNYKVAFDAATDMLKDAPGSKVVYLISDGLPTEGGDAERGFDPKHREAALKAAEGLRKSVSDLTYNTVFLGDLAAQEEEAGFDPREFLVELTGDADRVKLVEKAEDLTKGILALEPPDVDLDLDSATATVSAEGVPDEEVGFEFFQAHEDKDLVWSFRTNVFGAFPGNALATKLTIRADDKTGAKYKLVYSIAPQD